MNLKNIVDEINRMLSSVPPGGPKAYEFRVSIEMMDDIYWHLKNHLERHGNEGRPPPRSKEQERYRKGWENIWGTNESPFENDGWESPFQKQRRAETAAGAEKRQRQEEEALREQMRREQEKYSRYFEELLRRGSAGRGSYEKAYAGFEEAFRRASQQEYQSKGKTPYEILGVRTTATKMEIIKAYRHLAMKYHPDRKPHGDTKKFQEIQAAKEQLVGR